MKLGRYDVLSELGRGGMGVVVRARSPEGREVAIKLLQKVQSSDALQRFAREERLLHSLGEDQGFVALIERGESPHGPFLVMPLIAGGTLRRRLERGPLPLADAIDLALSLARGMERAHALGIVHRDLKPDNVLYTKNGVETGDWGRPLIADLGLGKHFRASTAGTTVSVDLSKTGTMRGTAGYMPPEQMRDAKSVGPEADVFAIGAILYESLTGVPAFAGDSALTVVARVDQGLTQSVRSMRPEAPRWLAAIVERALEHAPEDRFADGGELTRALEAEDRNGRGPGRLLAVALAVLLVLAAAAPFAIRAAAARREPAGTPPVAPSDGPRTDPPREEARSALAAIPATKLTRLDLVLGDWAWATGGASGPDAVAFLGTDRAVAAADETVWIFKLATGELVRTIEPGRGHISCVAASPDARQLVVASVGRPAPGRDSPRTPRAPAVELYAAEGGELVHTLREKDPALSTVFSSDGRFALAGFEDGTLRIYAAEDGRLLHELPTNGPIRSIAVSDPEFGGVPFAAGACGNSVHVWELDSATELGVSSYESPVTATAICRDGTLALFGRATAIPHVLSLTAGSTINSFQHTPPVRAVGFASNDVAITGGDDGRLALWSAREGRALGDVPIRAGPPGATLGHVRAVATSKDGRNLLAAGWDSRLRLIDVATRKTMSRWHGARSEIASIAVSPDGTRLATASRDGSLRLYDARTGELVTETDPRGELWSLAFLPDGKRLAVGGQDGARLWDDSKKGEVELASSPTRSVAVSPDGTCFLATVLDGGASFRDLARNRNNSLPAPAKMALPQRAAFTAGGGRVFLRLDTARIAVLDGSSSATVRELGGASGALSVLDLSSDGAKVAAARDDGAVLLWDTTSDRAPLALAGHAGRVVDAVFGPDGGLLVTAGDDRTLRLWDTASGQELDRVDLAPVHDRPSSVGFAPAGHAFFAGTERGVVLRFALRPR